jgi:cobalamin biosynthesis Mg chelatase CobN
VLVAFVACSLLAIVLVVSSPQVPDAKNKNIQNCRLPEPALSCVCFCSAVGRAGLASLLDHLTAPFRPANPHPNNNNNIKQRQHQTTTTTITTTTNNNKQQQQQQQQQQQTTNNNKHNNNPSLSKEGSESAASLPGPAPSRRHPQRLPGCSLVVVVVVVVVVFVVVVVV